MDALECARVSACRAYRARVAYAGLLYRTGARTSLIVEALRSEFGVSRRTAFRVLQRARATNHTEELKHG